MRSEKSAYVRRLSRITEADRAISITASGWRAPRVGGRGGIEGSTGRTARMRAVRARRAEKREVR